MDYITPFENQLVLQRPLCRETSTHYILSTEVGLPQPSTESGDSENLPQRRGVHLKLLLIAQWICVFLFLMLFTLMLTLFPIWKKEQSAVDYLQNLWAPLWLLLTLSRFFILALTTYLGRAGCRVPAIMGYCQRCLQCLGLLWFFHGIKLLFWDPPENIQVVRFARALWIMQAVFLLIPFFLYIIICFCVPFLLILRYRMRSTNWNHTPTPESILSKLEVKKYKDLLHESKNELPIEPCALRQRPLSSCTSNYFTFSGTNSTTFESRNTKQDSLNPSDTLKNLDPSDIQLLRVEKSCPICMIDFEEKDDVMRMPCDKRHFFHVECVRLWLHASQYCPICRANVVEKLTTKDTTDHVHTHQEQDFEIMA